MARRKLSHVDEAGRVQMVDVSDKPETERVAVARALLRCKPGTRAAIAAGTLAKGEALAAARIAGVMAAKRTGELIPMCHPLALTDVKVDFAAVREGIAIEATARTVGRTGVEMEAMVAAAVAGLTLYDMAKAVERGMVLDAVRLVEKRGGKSGIWRRPGERGVSQRAPRG
jgi:cyclic pyranopterin monophosphate synthase